MRKRIDEVMVEMGMVQSRAHASRLIGMSRVTSAGRTVRKAGQLVYANDPIEILGGENYVSRAGFKLASAAKQLKLKFKDLTVLDVGSSTGGFTDYALQNGAKKVVAVDVGTDQLHPTLRGNPKVDLYEKTDIRNIDPQLIKDVDFVVIDVSFISVREILPFLLKNLPQKATILVMAKPQFEAGDRQKNKGVIKNDTIRREILKSFEDWVKQSAVIAAKADSEVHGEKGNRERFYLLNPLKTKR